MQLSRAALALVHPGIDRDVSEAGDRVSRSAGLVPARRARLIPDIGNDDTATLVKAGRRITDLGYKAVPHVASRRLTTRAALKERIKASAEEAGVRDLLVIGGDVQPPQGEFSSSLDVLETGFLDRYGIKHIGIAGHPEGSPSFSEEVALQALKLKHAFGKRTDAKAPRRSPRY